MVRQGNPEDKIEYVQKSDTREVLRERQFITVSL